MVLSLALECRSSASHGKLVMKLALFDLDHTLIPFDSGMAWTRHLVRAGALDTQAEVRYLDFCHAYVAGTLDIHAMHHASMAPLAAFAAEQIQRWQSEFEREQASALSPAMLALVARHRDGGDLCAIVTASSRLVAEPFARSFRIEHLLATETVRIAGVATGTIAGVPCYREHKLSHVQAWLAARPVAPRALADFDESWFYSDSTSDLPLLAAVTHPVAVRPDARLRVHAMAAGWRIVDAV
ncbi:MAG: HAD-IB family hydrolase [Burkholderiaceae bacterium]